MPDPHISAAAQADIAHVLQWSFDHFGADAEARYAALIATAIRHAADSRDSPGFKRRTELPGEIVSWHLSQSVRQTGADRAAGRVIYLCVDGLATNSRSPDCSTRRRIRA